MLDIGIPAAGLEGHVEMSVQSVRRRAAGQHAGGHDSHVEFAHNHNGPPPRQQARD